MTTQPLLQKHFWYNSITHEKETLKKQIEMVAHPHPSDRRTDYI